ncbi:hypothetical protein [Shimia sp. SK013]|uniref:hypothetical protein n=1 Tax=Shimia sp. SK013 TaxID=1389006 RepID=UPI00187CE4EC|nr:hypothetical protein [Shimia sp. SK013]
MDVLICLSPLVLLLVSTRVSLHRGINLADEGYLAYGTQEVLRGKIPIRDFRAYDPARYYWCALWCRLIGSEFIAIRISMAFMSGLSLCLVSWMVFSASGNPWLSAVVAATALLWMFPRHKQIEHFFSLGCCAVMFSLLSGTGQPFWLGATGALGAAFGLNILAYFVGSATLTFLAIGLLYGTSGLIALPVFALGLGASISFLVLCYALVPGFLRCYLDLKVLALFRRKTTNLALPKPWIWNAAPRQFAGFSRLRRLVLQALFTLLPVVYLANTGFLLVTADADRAAQLVLASSLVGLIYYHHALSRADLNHIHQVIQPFLVTVAAGLAGLLPISVAPAAMLLIGVASAALLWKTPAFSESWSFQNNHPVTWVNGADTFRITEELHKALTQQRDVVEACSNSQDTLFVAPAAPALLALFHRRSAVYDTFPVYPASEAAQTRMLEDLKASDPPVAIISNGMIDGRKDLRFDINYALVFEHLRSQYHLQDNTPSGYIFVRREQGTSVEGTA